MGDKMATEESRKSREAGRMQCYALITGQAGERFI